MTVMDAFAQADQVLLSGVQGITDLITTPGLINVDFADVRTVMRGAGSALLGIGAARGEDRASIAAEMAISSPLLEASMEGAQGVLIYISGGSDLGLFEIHSASEIVRDSASADANIIFGAVIDDALGDEVRITVIAAGFEGGAPRRIDAGTRSGVRTGVASGVVPAAAAVPPPAAPAQVQPSAAPEYAPASAAPAEDAPFDIDAPSPAPRARRPIVFDDDDLDVPDFLK